MKPPNPRARVTIAFELAALHVQQLDRIATCKGLDRNATMASLIGRAFEELGNVDRGEAPWKVTLKAKESFLAIVDEPLTPDNLDWADDALHAACIDALEAEKAGRRKPSRLESGALRYRGPGPRRLSLIVFNGALVEVLR